MAKKTMQNMDVCYFIRIFLKFDFLLLFSICLAYLYQFYCKPNLMTLTHEHGISLTN